MSLYTINQEILNLTSEAEAVEKANNILFGEKYSNCCGAGDIFVCFLVINEGVCADCGEHCEMEAVLSQTIKEHK